MSLVKRYDVMSPKESNGKTFWNRIGVAFLNKAENGYNVVLDAMPAPTDGAFRFSLFEPKENSNSGGSNGYGSNGGGNGGNSNSSGGSKRPSANVPSDADDDIPF